MCRKKLNLLTLVLLVSNAAAETIVITANRMLDAERGEVSGPVRILITDGLIESVNPDSVPLDAEVIALGDHTLLPGLIDMHTHLTGDYFTGDNWVTMSVYETAPDWAVLGTKFARETLEAGFTTVRDAGALPGFPDVALMKAINRDTVPGPDMWPAGHYISITGGHCDITGFAPGDKRVRPQTGYCGWRGRGDQGGPLSGEARCQGHQGLRHSWRILFLQQCAYRYPAIFAG